MWPFKPRNRVMLEKQWINLAADLWVSNAVRIGNRYYAKWSGSLIRLNEDGSTNHERLTWEAVDPISEWR